MESVSQLRTFRKTLPSVATLDDTVREAMMLEARKLLLDLEQPQDVIARLGFRQIETMACSIAIKSGVFRALAKKSPQTLEEIARSTGVDPLLLERVLRCLASYGAVGQNGRSFTANMVSSTLTRPNSEAAIAIGFEFHSRVWARVPEFLQNAGWKNPTTDKDNAYTAAWNMPPGSTLFQTLQASRHGDSFFTYMTVFDEGHKPWTEFYPVLDRIAANLDPYAPTLVDVAGGLGQQTVKFKNAFNLPGKHIVQDFDHVFPAESQRMPGIHYMVHNFNDEQPIATHGAAVYYMRYVPHNWSQDVCVHICTQLRKAMKPGYSKLIINEWIIPDDEPSIFMTSMDLVMMAGTGGIERTEKLHRDYLEKAGLTVTGIFQPGDSVSESVIEAMLIE